VAQGMSPTWLIRIAKVFERKNSFTSDKFSFLYLGGIYIGFKNAVKIVKIHLGVIK
jgi:hypothetical protein